MKNEHKSKEKEIKTLMKKAIGVCIDDLDFFNDIKYIRPDFENLELYFNKDDEENFSNPS